MKQRWMLVGRCIAICTAFFMIVVLLYSFRLQQAYTDLWQQLGIARESGTQAIKESFFNGYLQYYGARNIKNITTGDKAAVTKDLLQFTRQYVESEAFKKAYDTYRQERKPQVPEKEKSEADIRDEQVASLQKSIAELEKSLKTQTGDLKKILEESLATLRQQKKEYEKPDNEIIKMMAQGEKMQHEQHVKEYEQQTEKWKMDFPESSKAFVKARLQEMLNVTKDVDYNAQLVERYNKKYFSNPVYEKKPANWKYAFRAGKEVTETARAFAQEWMKTL